MKTIAFLNIKGGVGKTTASINVAAGLAMKGKKVLLVDCDPQSNASYIFCGIADHDKATQDVLLGEATIEEVRMEINPNLHIVPATLALIHVDAAIRVQTGKPQHNMLKKALAAVADEYDYCIIDCSPNINLITVNILLVCDLLMIPIKPDVFALQGLTNTLESMNEIMESWGTDLDYQIMFAIVNRNNAEKEMIMQVKGAVTQSHICPITIRNQPKPICEASAERMPIVMKTGKHIPAVAEELNALVDYIVEWGGDDHD